ncbi:MAG: Fur family transcriptional regulator [Armatimonadota bacterium]
MSESVGGDKADQDRVRGIVGKLRSHGHRITPQRVAIIREFVARCDHPSAEAIHESLSAEFPMMALSTVYSTLRLLVELGEAAEVSATSETRFDPDVGNHCHLTCLSCKRIIDLPMDACLEAEEAVEAAQDRGFEPVRRVYQIFGYCAECRDAAE